MNANETISFWKRNPGVHSELQADMTCDVCIVGAGISGLSAAYALADEVKSVIVLDQLGLGQGETERTSAHLSNVLDRRYHEIEAVHGIEGVRLAVASHSAAIDAIEMISRIHQISCQFERVEGKLFAANEDGEEEIDREFETILRAELKATLHRGELPFAGKENRSYLKFDHQAQFHPTLYLAGLADAVLARGGRIYYNTRVLHIEEGALHEVHTANGPVIRARNVIAATNTPFNNYLSIHARQASYRSYVVAAPLPKTRHSPCLYWDTLDPFHFIRFYHDEHGQWVIAGDEDHKTGQLTYTNPFDQLSEWLRLSLPEAGPISHAWSGQINESMDGLALIGRNPGSKEGIYVVSGDSGLGLTHGTIAGLLLTDLIMGRPNLWTGLYDPDRLPLRAVGEITRENVNTAMQYLDWFKPSVAVTDLKLAPHDGCIAHDANLKVAACRDNAGELHLH